MPTELELPALPDPHDTHAPHMRLEKGSVLRQLCDLIWNTRRGLLSYIENLDSFRQGIDDSFRGSLINFLYALREAESSCGVDLKAYYVSASALDDLEALALELFLIRDLYREMVAAYQYLRDEQIHDRQIDDEHREEIPGMVLRACRQIQALEIRNQFTFAEYFIGEMHYTEVAGRILRHLERIDVLDQDLER